MRPEPSLNATAQSTARLVAAAAVPGSYCPRQKVLRRRNEPGCLLAEGPSAAEAVAAFHRVLIARKSEVILTWPQRLNGVAALHGLVALDFLGDCDSKRLTTLFFPWNRNSGGSQRQILVDRDFVYRTTLPALNRVLPHQFGYAPYPYVLALHSLNNVTKTKNSRFLEALKTDPGLEHPTLYEIMPQQGLQITGLQPYEAQFLSRLRRHTWVAQRENYMRAAIAAERTPFFLAGVDTDVIKAASLRQLGVDPSCNGRLPDILLIDLMSRARDRLGQAWQRPLRQLLDVCLELYLDDCPPVLAVTDDVFVCDILRNSIIREHDKWRSADVKGSGAAVKATVILTVNSDPLDQEIVVVGTTPAFTVEAYGTDVLRTVENGLRLRRSLLDVGQEELAEVVGTATTVIQNVLALPGQPREFHDFLATHYDGYQRHRWGARFDHQAPHSKMAAVIKSGLAGTNHELLAEFLRGFDDLRSVADLDNPGRRRFDSCVRHLLEGGKRSVIVFPSELQLAFAEWRVEHDPALADIRAEIEGRLVFLDRKELSEQLNREDLNRTALERLVLLEPRPDDLVRVLGRGRLPANILVLANLARIEQALRRVRILLTIGGIDPLKDRLTVAQRELESALAGHISDIGDFDSDVPNFDVGVLDLTEASNQTAGPVRIIMVSDHSRIRAFEASEFALYEPDAVRHFSRRLAKDLRPGDQICVFTPEFIGMAREKLRISANAPDVLKNYHKAVIDKAVSVLGRDMAAKAATVRARMRQIDPGADFPSEDTVRRWLDVADLLDAPRDSVRPQAPGSRRHYVAFMKALSISDDVAQLYWDLGIFSTRSKRIQRGAFFHQTFMAVLIDPDGTASRLDEGGRSEMWRIYEAAEDHVETVISNELEKER